MENVHFDREGASHSLAVVAVVLIFNEEIGGEKLKELAHLNEDMADTYPKASKKTSLNVNIDDGTPSTKKVFAGWTLEAPNPDSSEVIDWQLEIESNRIVIRCFNYSGWTEFSEKAIDSLANVCHSVKCEGIGLQEVGVQFVDRFNWDLSKEQYSLEKFFKPRCDYFPKNLLRHQTPLWHVFQGWKENIDGNGYIENINLSTNHAEDSPHLTEIVHIVRCVESEGGVLERISTDALRVIAKRAHDLNKELLHELLSEEAIKFIRLDD